MDARLPWVMGSSLSERNFFSILGESSHPGLLVKAFWAFLIMAIYLSCSCSNSSSAGVQNIFRLCFGGGLLALSPEIFMFLWVFRWKFLWVLLFFGFKDRAFQLKILILPNTGPKCINFRKPYTDFWFLLTQDTFLFLKLKLWFRGFGLKNFFFLITLKSLFGARSFL